MRSKNTDYIHITSTIAEFQKQNYSKLKSTCLEEKRLFVDDLFPPNDTSIYKNRKIPGLEWKRPKEICPDAKLMIGGADSKDVNQGQLGNCWFVAALSVLAGEKRIWNKVIPDYKEQEINDTDYAGIFKFRFWFFGEWVEVVIDDLLPTVNNKLIFTRSSYKNEFWSSLLEKAYAKLNGCYEHLDGGSLNDAMQDFTGGICETIRVEDRNEMPNKQLFEAMKKANERGSLMSCAINVKSKYEIEQKLSCGLVKGHAYGITKLQSMKTKGTSILRFISINKEELFMIRLKNPWGAQEWVGPWSDHSEEWLRVPKSEREKMGLTFEDDGEFWMEFCDFLKYFDEISICRTINTSVLSMRKTWSEGLVFGHWTAPDRAGGCINNRERFCSNPQYRFEIENDDTEKPDEVLINLDQLNLRYLGKENFTIGFMIMRVEDNRKYRLHKIKPKSASSLFINSRSVCLRTKLPDGRYVIIPSTYEPDIEASFLLRIYSDNSNNLKELKKECPVPLFASINPFAKYASCVTSILVRSGQGLVNPDLSKKLDTYVSIKCEGQKLVGRTFKDSCNPIWNTSAIYYRFQKNKPIKIEVWMKKPLRDEIYGEVYLDAEPDNRHIILECKLASVDGGMKNGKIELEIQSMTNLTAI